MTELEGPENTNESVSKDSVATATISESTTATSTLSENEIVTLTTSLSADSPTAPCPPAHEMGAPCPPAHEMGAPCPPAQETVDEVSIQTEQSQEESQQFSEAPTEPDGSNETEKTIPETFQDEEAFSEGADTPTTVSSESQEPASDENNQNCFENVRSNPIFAMPEAAMALPVAYDSFRLCQFWMEDTSDKWVAAGEKNGVVRQRLDRDWSEPCIVRGQTFVPEDKFKLDVEALIDWIWKPVNILKFDPTTKAVFRLKTWQEEADPVGLCTYRQCFRGRFGFSGRDFQLVGGKKRISKSHYLICGRSTSFVANEKTTEKSDVFDHLVSEAQKEEIKKLRMVSASIIFAGLDCKRMEDGRVRLRHISQADLKEPLAPRMLANSIAVDQLQRLADIREYVAKKGIE
eukprot:Filipodium_phascolosomae@DN516_c0_g1_i1.p1